MNPVFTMRLFSQPLWLSPMHAELDENLVYTWVNLLGTEIYGLFSWRLFWRLHGAAEKVIDI